MKKIYVFMLFVLTPVIALIILGASYDIKTDLGGSMENKAYQPITFEALDIKLSEPEVDLRDLSIQMANLQNNMVDYVSVFKHFDTIISDSIADSQKQKTLSDDIYEQRITKALGAPIDFHLDSKTEIKIFELKELGYRGYIAKVKLFDPYAFKLALAKDQTNTLETISEVANRRGAIFAINGGGFGARKENDEFISQMIGAAVVDGKMVKEFVHSEEEDLFFVGTDKFGNLVGNVPKTSQDIMALNPQQGVSFIPILIENGKKMPLPGPWKTSKHPRTIIGQYANDDLIMIVVDGRQGEWSSGITLERLQEKLIELGVKDAYNLDGGGSTAMYFKGRILNKPSSGYERPVANHFIIVP
jgi:exopolysaccharide biosynthesis protein